MGAKLFNNPANLVTVPLIGEIEDENGLAVTGRIWLGDTTDNCNEWVGTTGYQARSAYFDDWGNRTLNSCSAALRLLCLQQP